MPGYAEEANPSFSDLLDPANDTTDIWQVVSRMPAGRISVAIREINSVAGYHPRKSAILSALYFHWAESDPQAALDDARKNPEPGSLVRSVLAAWMRSDSAAAYESVKEGEHEYIGRDMMVRIWTPETLFEGLERHMDKHKLLLGWYCVSLSDKEEARNEMLATLARKPRMKDGDWGESLLFRSWGYRDFDAAMTKARTLLSPNMTKQLIRENVGDQPRKALPWASEIGYPPGGPDWEKGYARWLGEGDGSEARKWFAKQAPVWESAGHFSAVASFCARDLEHSKTIPSQNAVEGEALAGVITRWREKDPNAVRSWLDTAPSAAVAFINGNGGNHENP